MFNAHKGSLYHINKQLKKKKPVKELKNGTRTCLLQQYLVASSSSCIKRTQNIDAELYMPQPIGFSAPSATSTISPVLGGGLPMILSTAPLYTMGLPSLKSCVFPFLSTTFATLPDPKERTFGKSEGC